MFMILLMMMFFKGRCEILIEDGDDEFLGYGFILGSFSGTGTSLIMDYRDRLYAHSPYHAVDRSWKYMRSAAAALVMDSQDNITLREIPKMLVKALGY
jgi:hypothetical protein